MKIKLYTRSADCCGCAACANACQTQAISMMPDHDGFLYPVVDGRACSDCGLCEHVCPIRRNAALKEPREVYAAVNMDPSQLALSSSGGVFSALAGIVLDSGGVVFGCAFDDSMLPVHTSITRVLDLPRLQGSKYAQSTIGNAYVEVKALLDSGTWVLFTGTPCQVAGLNAYLGVDYDNLVTADLVCHGVPSPRLLRDFIKHMEGRLKGRVVELSFRDKSRGWGMTGKVRYLTNGETRDNVVPHYCAYLHHFSHGDILRDSCYECVYACTSRVGDFTIGDYWGIENAHPGVDARNGVSLLLANSAKATRLLSKLSTSLNLTRSTLALAMAHNPQLYRPTPVSPRRRIVLKSWRDGGYRLVAKRHLALNWKMIMVRSVWSALPRPWRQLIRRLTKR